MTADELLPKLANFTGLTYNRRVLHGRDEELRMQCESPSARQPKAGFARTAALNAGRSSGRRSDRPLM